MAEEHSHWALHSGCNAETFLAVLCALNGQDSNPMQLLVKTAGAVSARNNPELAIMH